MQILLLARERDLLASVGATPLPLPKVAQSLHLGMVSLVLPRITIRIQWQEQVRNTGISPLRRQMRRLRSR
jgi:hypothetical protein